MLQIPTRLAPSVLHGLGLFAVERIEPGTTIWQFQAPFDIRLGLKDLARIPRHSSLRFHIFEDTAEPGVYILCGDEARYTNHSQTPNSVIELDRHVMVAARDIEVGEEITEDYHSICALRRQFGPHISL